jgi:hypothetical protein
MPTGLMLFGIRKSGGQKLVSGLPQVHKKLRADSLFTPGVTRV